MNIKSKTKTPFPTKQQIRTFIEDSDGPVGKREIAKAFNIKGANRIPLKKLLKELVVEGGLEQGRKRELSPKGTLPAVAVIEMTGLNEDGEALAKPVNFDDATSPPVIYLVQDGKTKTKAPGKGDRLLARLSRSKDGTYDARVIRALQTATGPVLGVFTKVAKGGRVQPTDRKLKKEIVIREENSEGAQSGEVVLCEILPGKALSLPEGRVRERLGPMGDAASVSLIAIHAHGIPSEFSPTTLKEATSAQPVSLGSRTDLRDIPFITIDPADARDRDDAVWAAADEDPKNKGGWQIIVAIADVAHYVRSGSALEKSAKERGNSVYFPDRVVPMLPHELSSDLCSLHENVDRPVMAVQMWFDADGNKLRHKFMRALIRSRASLTYRQAQNAWEGHPDEATELWSKEVIQPLYKAHEALKKARMKRQPLDLELPERRIEMGEDGFIKAVHKKHRFQAHMLIEEFMIQANVAAAETLNKLRHPCMFRVHEPPSADKMQGLHEVLREMNISFAKGQVMKTEAFNRILGQSKTENDKELLSSLVLRTQSQAVYSPNNLHHFGLNLQNYAHFTSPIRRYADLLVHRSLITALKLGDGGLENTDADDFEDIGVHISGLERRAMIAERETNDRFTAVFLVEKVGETFSAKVSGVTRAGLFLTFDDTGADALIPISTLGQDYFRFDADKHTLVGERTGQTYRLADRLTVRLKEVNIVTASMIAEIADGTARSRSEKSGNAKRQTSNRRSQSRSATARPVKKKKKTMPKGKKRALRKKRND
ncbi:ribonuclease R [Sneathiella marina]|uniref:Ribonuclease R n=1 Tax=Sneathiella marina TaxID=2950108 RepID=A0ABY4VZM5_9PROT|nr:ribonuclease R [Sneathiella marina]USG60142.1 ribonuclease R [Sneathiella marina]